MKKLLVLVVSVFSVSVFAEDAATATAAAGSMAPIAKALCMALAAIGVATGQGKAAASALEGIARNPSSAEKMQTPLILSLALLEAVAILAFVIALSI